MRDSLEVVIRRLQNSVARPTSATRTTATRRRCLARCLKIMKPPYSLVMTPAWLRRTTPPGRAASWPITETVSLNLSNYFQVYRMIQEVHALKNYIDLYSETLRALKTLWTLMKKGRGLLRSLWLDKTMRVRN